MLIATTQPETLTSAASTSNALLVEDSRDCPPDAAVKDGNLRIERRRNAGFSGSPIDILMRLPAVVVLERLPVPSLAMGRDGTILFANTAFAELWVTRRTS